MYDNICIHIQYVYIYMYIQVIDILWIAISFTTLLVDDVDDVDAGSSRTMAPCRSLFSARGGGRTGSTGANDLGWQRDDLGSSCLI